MLLLLPPLPLPQDYCHFRRVPRELRERLMGYVEAEHSNKRVLNDVEVLSTLSPALRTDLSMHLCTELVRSVALFQVGGWMRWMRVDACGCRGGVMGGRCGG